MNLIGKNIRYDIEQMIILGFYLIGLKLAVKIKKTV